MPGQQNLFAPNGTRLDEIDVAILAALNENARIPNAELARGVGLSPSATMQRARRLEEAGAIRRYLAEVDESILDARSLLLVALDLQSTARPRRVEFEELLSATPEILEVIEVAGAPDYLALVSIPRGSEWPALRARVDPDNIYIGRAKVVPAVKTLKGRSLHPLLRKQTAT